MLANELIDRLERLGLLDQEIIEALREQLDQGGTRVTPEAIAKLLVDNGQLTHFQATKLIGELRSGQYDDDASEGSEEADLTAGLDDLAVVPDEADEVTEGVQAVEVFEAEPLAYEPVAVEAVPVEGVAAVDTVAEAPQDRPRPQSARKKRDESKSVWDSFKIYGFLTIIAILTLCVLFFVFVLNRGNEDEWIKEANSLYDQQNYSGAQVFYLNFLDKFGEESQYSSLARTRITMTELYKAAEFKQEPEQAVELAKEKLPLIAEEEAMNEERGNLAALLVDIAANIANSADKAKETKDKQRLLAVLDEQLGLMEEPMYMPTSMKTTLASQIQSVTEARARVQRNIDRNIRLDESEASIKRSLDEKKTKEAYDTRKELLRQFPELHDNERLVSLIARASDIQQTLVQPSSNLPELIEDAPASDSIRSIVLTTLAGTSAPDLIGQTLYFRAGGSILAFEGESGKLRWRKFVGYAKDLPPLPLDDGSGVLLSESASLQVMHCRDDDGGVAWRSTIGEEFSQPISVGDDVYVATLSGRLVSLDADSGDAKWATQFPQPLESGPGVDDRANRAYITGNHSSLYVLNTRDGSCLESFYIGHEEGAITVPAVPLLGHVFVIENAGSDYALVHVLRVNETGESIKIAQPPFRLTGNVRVPPIIQGRRLIVLTDRGEVVVLDIEPTAERDQVTVAATLPAFYDQPTATQMAVGKSQMWITGTRIGRYELQINTGKVVRDWSLHELDSFFGKPYSADEALVYARVLRGSSAIRITAATPKRGEEIWRTDVGVPVAMLTPISGGKGFHVVTSQAAMFQLDREALGSGSTEPPIENPGAKAVAIRFENPIAIDETRSLMLNQVDGQSIVVYEPKRTTEKLRLVTLQLRSGKPTAGGIVSGGGLFLPLDTGRAVLLDWRTGAMLGSPFQPASDPAGRVQWTTPLALASDPDQIVLADSRKKIYRLRVGEQIRELASKDLEYELIGPAARVADTMVATTPGPASDYVVGFEMTSLNEQFKTLLEGRVAWGPTAAGDLCLVQTDDSMLRGIAADGTQKFEVKLPPGRPVGQPIVVGDSIVLAGKPGWLVTINPATGQLLGTTDVGQPIAATPVLAGKNLLVPGEEGVVVITEIPSS
jgi:outer membrane protein assembly factor BamB